MEFNREMFKLPKITGLVSYMILVTGANSLLGANVIPELLGAGYAVRGLVRDIGGYKGMRHPELHLVEGDFCDPECLKGVMPGCDAVIHIAAVTSRSRRHYSEYYEVNVRGTRRLIESAVKNGARRFLAVSSANVFGYGSREIPGCELNEMCEPFASSYYSRSKYESLQAALSYKDRIDVIAVAPTFMLGPYDSKPGPGRIIRMGYGRKVVFCPPGGVNFVHAGDAAAGVVSALERGENGETYLLCGENLTYREFFRKLDTVTGNRSLCITVPSPLLYIAGGIGSFFRAFGVRTQVSLPNMRILCTTGYYHNYKASRDLGVTFGPVEKAIADAVGWFVAEGMLKRGKVGSIERYRQ